MNMNECCMLFWQCIIDWLENMGLFWVKEKIERNS